MTVILKSPKKASWEDGRRCWRGGCSWPSFSSSIFTARMFQSLSIHPLFSLHPSLPGVFWLHCEFLHNSAFISACLIVWQSPREATVTLHTFCVCVCVSLSHCAVCVSTRAFMNVHLSVGVYPSHWIINLKPIRIRLTCAVFAYSHFASC